MDPNANASNPKNMNNSPDTPGSSDHTAEVSALKAWFRENRVSLIVTAVVVGLVVVYLDPIDTLKVILGLGLVIFIHELGHFLAAKWCDVHVRTFSIGFGPAVPFCSYKWGETTYMVGIIPLGGYVSMVGEGDNAGEDEAEEDPRSFRKKTVGQRMLIISAGVIMNILLGMACFVAAYMHGVQEKPATVGWVESGGAAWRAGIHADDDIVRIASRDKPFFNDMRPYLMATQKGDKVDLVIQHPERKETQAISVEPLKEEGARFPQLGVAPPYRLTLLSIKKKGFRPTMPGSVADAAKDPGFEPGDKIVAMTNPDDPTQITPLNPDLRDPEIGPDINDFYRRMEKLAGKPVTIRVVRKLTGETADVLVQPAYRSDLGLRMRMGKIVALRSGGPAEQAGVEAWSEETPTRGDRIKTIKFPEPDGREIWLTTGDLKNEDPKIEVRKLDPVLLPTELKRWADRMAAAGESAPKVRLEVLRQQGHEEAKPVELSLQYDKAYRYDREVITLPNSPVPLGGLGLAYWVEGVVDDVEPGSPADGKLQRDDIITAVRFKIVDGAGTVQAGDWEEIKPHQWASIDYSLQSRPNSRIDVKVKRGDQEIEVLDLQARPDTRYPSDDIGLVFQQDFRIQKATSIGDAAALGYQRTVRFIREVYMNLYAMAFGRVSAKTMSGPLTIANVSYRFAGEDFWQFLLFLGMISVNLAVVNFLPIPVLDGGHMVFLLLEWILGRPVPEKVFAAAMWTGLFMILSLMVFVIVLDIRRLFFGWF